MAVVIMVAITWARDLLMPSLKLILMLMLVSFMEDMVLVAIAVASMEAMEDTVLVDMADMVLDIAVATSVVMEDIEDIMVLDMAVDTHTWDKESNL